MSGGMWSKTSEIEGMEPVIVKTIGWVVKETDKFVTVVSSTEENHVGGDVLILKSCIKKRKNVKI